MKILITGCSRGIGREFIHQYLLNPNVTQIFAVTRNASHLEALTQQHGVRLKLISLSVTEESAKENLTELLKTETLDLLINNAGFYPEEAETFSEIKIESLQAAFEVNVFAAFRTTQACLQALQKSKQAKVISITSLMGSIADNTSGGSYAYRISKAALNMMNKSFANDFPKIISAVLHPGWVKTEMGGSAAPTTVQESVSGMIKVIEALNLEKSGNFYDFEGDALPW